MTLPVLTPENVTPVVPQRATPAMHTFAEEMGQPPFDWNAFLAQPSHTDAEWREALGLAGNWVTCACGNQCAATPRWRLNEEGNPHKDIPNGPKDIILNKLGMRFWEDIDNKSVAAARETLSAVELRSAELLREMAARP